MSVLMRRENTLIIEPGSDISKIQIINFILLPNSKKHFEGPPLYLDGMSNEAQEFLNQCLFQPSIQAQNLMQNQFVIKQENVEVDALQPENNNTQYKYKGENCSESALEALGRKLKFGHDQTVKCETEALWEDSLENLADNIILK
ncbi:Hypothetical_protein [Hexamita inflata]|uniref:Hypothetical_protein n=1 Tax=Hexamita inflata TaxID=28002 RepID=A0AA86R243_9EUKA|nr:Hypothetical protein HINF_LOCUS53231 [Hexamita inflata]